MLLFFLCFLLFSLQVGACVYSSKTIEFSGIRAQVSELWSRGERVMCGAVNDDTRVAFRSSTAMVYMFLQMSSEMWDFDTNGKYSHFVLI